MSVNVQLLTHTPEPEKVVAAAAKLCYSNSEISTLMAGLTPEKTTKFIEMLASLGHASPTEHANFTFGIEGVSRALLAQITRHRIASYSVQSQRYVRLEDFSYVTPPHIEDNTQAKHAFESAVKNQAQQYKEIAQILKDGHIHRLMKEGLSEQEASRKAEKLAIEDARFILPNACDTKMIVTMNTRSLNNFFEHRCCNRAQWEIKALADEMLKLVLKVAPSLFCNSGAPCVSGPCPEGKMTCGKIKEVREHYEKLKAEVKENG